MNSIVMNTNSKYFYLMILFFFIVMHCASIDTRGLVHRRKTQMCPLLNDVNSKSVCLGRRAIGSCDNSCHRTWILWRRGAGGTRHHI